MVSAKDARDRFETPDERKEYGLVSIFILVFAIGFSFIPGVSFTNVMLYMILMELIAVKVTLRKGLTPVN